MKKILLLSFVLLTLLKSFAQDGMLDSSFGTNGSVKLGITYDATAFQSDGKLIGLQKIQGGFTITRYNTNGTIDATFGSNGTVTTIIPYLTTPDKVLVAVQAGNDNIIVQEDGSSSYGPIYSTYTTMGLARFTSNGVLDTTFGTGGIVVENTDVSYQFGSFPHISFLTIQGDGKIVTAVNYGAYRKSWFMINRYNTDGSYDFSITVQPSDHTRVTALAAGGIGKIAMRVNTSNHYSPYNAETKIITIGDGVSQTFDVKSGSSPYSALTIQIDGKVLAAMGGVVSRFNNDGTKDVSFGLNGTINTGLTVNQILIEENGRIVIAGSLNGDFALYRYNSDGTLNYTFGTNGKTITDFGGTENIQNIIITNGRLYAYGTGILAAYQYRANCVAPTYNSNSAIVNSSCGKNDGSISIVPTSGASPFQYSIDAGKIYVPGPDAGYTFTLAAGVYQLRLKDANGCQSEVLEKTVKSNCLPSITSFTPASGIVGTSVTITGANFSPDAANNIVYFGAVKAKVTGASTTSLTVTVPAGATYQPISVTTNNLTAYSSQRFVLTFPNNNQSFTPGSFAPKTDFPTGPSPNILAVGDIDGDGKPDMVVATNYISVIFTPGFKVSVFRNTSSNGTISFERTDLSINTIAGIALGDLDGDGKLDLAAAVSGIVYILKNTSTVGSVSFSQTSFSIKGDVRSTITESDLDGDGKPDLILPVFKACAEGHGPVVSVLRNLSNNGNISFSEEVQFGNGCDVFQGALASDVDGDGKPDMNVSGYGFRNTSIGSYLDFASVAWGGSGIIGDVDGDGKPDLSSSNIIYRNISTPGTIAFSQITLPAGTGGSSSIADLDGDGKPDLVDASMNTITVSKNLSTIGNISFTPKVSYPAGTGGPAAIADFDGDGVPDIAVLNTTSGTVSILRNLMGSCTPPTFKNDGTIVLDASCGNNDGQISIIPTSGTAPFMYSIDGGATYKAGTNTGTGFTNLAPGTYKLRLKDANGCESAVVEKTIRTIYGGPTFTYKTSEASCGNKNGSITIVPTIGTGPFRYSIDAGNTYVQGPSTGYTFTNVAANTYYLRVKSAAGCESAIIYEAVKANFSNCTGAFVQGNITALQMAISPEVINTDAINPYPNPTKGQFKLQVKGFTSSISEVSIFNSEGKLVQKRQWNMAGTNTVDFDLTGKAKGMYYIKITSNSGTRTSKLLLQ